MNKPEPRTCNGRKVRADALAQNPDAAPLAVEARPALDVPDDEPTSPASQQPPSAKAARLLVMLRRPEGATLAAMMAETGWQAHSVRGFLSGHVRRKLGVTLSATVDPQGRIYWITDEPSNGAAS